MPQTRAIYKIKTDLTKQQILLKSMDTLIKGNCSVTSSLQATATQSNLKNNRWLSGNIPISQLIQEYTNRSLNNKYTNNCPEQTPWSTPDGCISCKEN